MQKQMCHITFQIPDHAEIFSEVHDFIRFRVHLQGTHITQCDYFLDLQYGVPEDKPRTLHNWLVSYYNKGEFHPMSYRMMEPKVISVPTGHELTFVEMAIVDGPVAIPSYAFFLEKDGWSLLIGVDIVQGFDIYRPWSPNEQPDVVIAGFRQQVQRQVDALLESMAWGETPQPDPAAKQALINTKQILVGRYAEAGNDQVMLAQGEEVQWTFYPDGTCSWLQNRYGGATISDHDPFTPGFKGTTTIGPRGNPDAEHTPFDVFTYNGAHYICRHHQGGLNSLHKVTQHGGTWQIDGLSA